MSDRMIPIPDTLYARAQRLAQRTNRAVEDVIKSRLADALRDSFDEISAAERSEQQAMTYLSDDTLWTIAREQLPAAPQQRLNDLLAKNSSGTITDTEREELEDLVLRGDKLMLRKSQAMKLLLERGYNVSLDDLAPSDG